MSDVKMYSKENIGWNNFSYDINGDVKAYFGIKDLISGRAGMTMNKRR